MKFLKLRISIIPLIVILSLLFINTVITKERISQRIEIQFPKPLRINEINFYKIHLSSPDIQNDELSLKIYNPSFKKSVYSFKIDRRNILITKHKNGITLEGYFFLPNVLPVGKGIIEIQSKNSVIYKEEIVFNPEIVFHSPIFQKGFPVFASEYEMGMQHSTIEAYPMSQICFSNPKKKSFFFFKIQLKDTNIPVRQTNLKLRIYVKQRILDEIIVDSSMKEYVYCLSKDFVGTIEWLKIRFETFTNDDKLLKLKEPIYNFEYLSLLPFNGLPNGINSFLKHSAFIEEKYR